VWRRRPAAPDPLDFNLAVPDAERALLGHDCPASEHRRLLGVEFSADEQAQLRAGAEVTIVMRCDRCVWQRRVLFRLE
jgi:hypothetical protein